MTRRIPVKRGAKPRKKKKRFGVTMSQLKQVTKGKELKDKDVCYHCDVNGFHPDTISTINLKGISSHGKFQVLEWIRAGNIYIDNDR